MNLLIGYGNELRGDDSVGPRLARAVAARGLPNVLALDVHQLTPELSETMSRAARVLFVDARHPDSGPGEAVILEPLLPEVTQFTTGSLTHFTDPAGLLALARILFGHAPPAWLLTIPGRDFDFSESLSPQAERALGEALRLAYNWLGGEDSCTKPA